MKNVGTLISGPLLFTNDLLFSSADLHNFAPEDKIKYQNDMTTERDIQNQIDFAMDKGRAEGRAEGRTEGRAEGRAEERAKIIKALKEQGVAEEVIRRVLSNL